MEDAMFGWQNHLFDVDVPGHIQKYPQSLIWKLSRHCVRHDAKERTLSGHPQI